MVIASSILPETAQAYKKILMTGEMAFKITGNGAI